MGTNKELKKALCHKKHFPNFTLTNRFRLGSSCNFKK